MNPKHLLITILLLLLAGALSSCAGGATAASSWPGLFLNEETAFIAYNTHVYAVNLTDGSEVWRFPQEPDNQITFYTEPALTTDGQLIVGSYNNTLYSIDPESGRLNWTFTGVRNRFVASPLATERGIFAANADKNVYALDFEGNLRWTFGLDSESWARPVSDPECTCLYVTSMDHTVYALDPESGKLLWRSRDLGGAIVGTPALSEDGALYVGTFGSAMLALDSQDGEELWRFPTEGWVWSGPALSEDRLYFGDLNGYFYAVDARTGTQVWRIGSEQLDGPIAGSPVVEEEAIYFTTESGTIYAVDLEGKILWSQPVGGKLYTPPATPDDIILVTPIETDDLLVALTKAGASRWTYNPNPE
jgi:outer membrane protein assembly factor BamB